MSDRSSPPDSPTDHGAAHVPGSRAPVIGDETAARALFDAWYARLFRFFRSRLAAAADADRLSSEVLVRVLTPARQAPSSDEDRGRFVFAAARTVLIEHLACRGIDASDVLHIRDEFLTEDARCTLRCIPADQRAALELRYVLGMSSGECAAAMGCTPSTLEPLLTRAAHTFQREWRRRAVAERTAAVAGSRGIAAGAQARDRSRGDGPGFDDIRSWPPAGGDPVSDLTPTRRLPRRYN